MQKKKILIVDDIMKNIQVLGRILGRQGYAVSYATNGAKALDIASRERFDLILLDIMMPEMNGFEVCRRLKQDPNTAQLPIIFLTARTETSDVTTGFKEGAVDYITKPFNSAELLARVRTHVDLKAAKEMIKNSNKVLLQRNKELEGLLRENQKALREIKALRGILPICSGCKKIRDDDGYWQQVETYIRDHSDAEFTHSLCPQCVQRFYPDITDTT